jgi:hypothetical protein
LLSAAAPYSTLQERHDAEDKAAAIYHLTVTRDDDMPSCAGKQRARYVVYGGERYIAMSETVQNDKIYRATYVGKDAPDDSVKAALLSLCAPQ